jgi:ferredoxin
MSKDPSTPAATKRRRIARVGGRLGRRLVDNVRERLSVVAPENAVGPFEVVFERANSDSQPVHFMATGGDTLLRAASAAGIDLPHYCGGQCSCGTCRIKVIAGAKCLSAQVGMEQMVLGSAQVGKGDRLACQAKIQGPVRVEIPKWF